MPNPDYKRVFEVFSKKYKLIPLEVFTDPFQILISTILSARTRDEVTLVVARNLFKKAPTPDKLNRLSVEEITKLIKGVGFNHLKARYLKETAGIMVKKHHGKVPADKESLVKLPGVGTKTANLVLNRAFKLPAISVDTHVHRISNILGWVKTKTPEQTEKELEKILPKEIWKDVNRLFVSIGQQYRSKAKLISFLRSNGLC